MLDHQTNHRLPPHLQSTYSSVESFMARVSSFPAPPPSPPLPSSTSEQRKVFTLWMKSLVLNGRGCTVYDSTGSIVYRVDNYGSSCSDNVYLMDLGGKIVLNILKKKLAFGKWEGYKWSGGKRQQEAAGAGAWFTVTRPCSSVLFQRSRRRPPSTCEFRSDGGRAMRYRMDDGCGACPGSGKQQHQAAPACCRIVDEASGAVVAEVKGKLTAGGVALGDDVLALTVEPNVDHALIMGMVLVYGLINHTM
uniref:Tubby C-terminal domain-containing protein n=1 Tax=Oryza brachyantha TaxID=4533 RepID=J3MP03_ORYBR